jgi:hypothetical protein
MAPAPHAEAVPEGTAGAHPHPRWLPHRRPGELRSRPQPSASVAVPGLRPWPRAAP